MSARGPKPKTPKNSRKALPSGAPSPSSILTEAALVEFFRICDVLSNRGTLDRSDPAVITEAARITDLLDRAYRATEGDTVDLAQAKLVGLLTTQRRGLLRELGLTLQPSRSVVKTTAKTAPDDDKWAGKLKVAGY